MSSVSLKESIKPHSDEKRLDLTPGLLIEDAKDVKEAAYVHHSYSSVFSNDLRTLGNATFRARELSARSIESAISLALKGCLSLHQDTLFKAVCTQNYIFSGSSPIATSAPLWIKLLHSPTGALRQVSQDWIKSADQLLSCLGLPLTTEQAQASIVSPELAYRLGKWELSEKLLEVSRDKHELGLRLQIAQLKTSDITLDEIEMLPQQDGIRQSVEASLILANARLGKNFELSRICSLKTWAIKTHDTQNGSVSDDVLLRALHVFNSLNLICFRKGEINEVVENLNLVASLAERIVDLEKKSHATGNLFYHKSMLERRERNADLELEYLFKANELDPGFTDYAYRIAQIFHDRADSAAGHYYLKALETSPFFHSLVNDYGCFLADLGSQEELRSWEKLAGLLSPHPVPGEERSPL